MLDDLRGLARAESVKNSNLAYGILKRAYLYQSTLNDQKSAISEFESVVETITEIEPNNWMVAHARGAIAQSYALNGDMKEADRLMAELQMDHDKYGPSAIGDYQLFAGIIEMEKGNYDTADTLFQKAYKTMPLFFMDELIARNHSRAGRIDDALKVYEKIINRYEPNRAYWPTTGVLTHFYYGRTLEKAGKHDEAMEQYETFLDIWRNADEGLAPVEEARKRLANLKDGS